MTLEKIHAVLGTDIAAAAVRTILERLGFGTKISGKKLKIHVPSWRATRDVQRPEDIIEEIARVYGYEHVAPELPKMNIAPPREDPARTAGWLMRDIAVGELGFSEVRRPAFVDARTVAFLGESVEHSLELDNPLDAGLLRQNLVPNLLTHLEQELHTRDVVQIFEIGRVFSNDHAGPYADADHKKRLPCQDIWFTAIVAQQGEKEPFRQVQRFIAALEGKSNNQWQLKKEVLPHAFAHPGRSAAIMVDDTAVGWITELHPSRGRALDITPHVGILGINISALSAILIPRKKYAPLPLHPEVRRDVAFLVDSEITHNALVLAITRASMLVTAVELFDVYAGKNIPAGQKSMAFHVTYYEAGRTLTSEEVDREHAAVSQALKKLGAKIR